jgi:RHH-type proline utilization regulon transcriptional repressor/proline dehydrogenase/delta 1-pyrroline-5-carboxylate dehydrogenase
MSALAIGDPAELHTDVGPLIDEQAYQMVTHHKVQLEGFGRKIAQSTIDEEVVSQGHYFAPVAYQIDDIGLLKGEVFGPVLHVVPYKADQIDQVIEDINALGYGLTFGVHSRIESFIAKLKTRIQCGNIYVNRGTIGAVVGVQPFGGRGLSGTGPKAGGPQYLHAFATEKVISTDTTAAGGNASLVMLDDN